MGVDPRSPTTEHLPYLPRRDTVTLQGRNRFGPNQPPEVNVIFVDDLEGYPFVSLALSTLHTLTGISPSG